MASVAGVDYQVGDVAAVPVLQRIRGHHDVAPDAAVVIAEAEPEHLAAVNGEGALPRPGLVVAHGQVVLPGVLGVEVLHVGVVVRAGFTEFKHGRPFGPGGARAARTADPRPGPGPSSRSG